MLVRSLRAQRKIGYRSFLGAFVFDSSVARPMQLPEALRQLALLAEFDASLPAFFSSFDDDQTKLNDSARLAPVPASTEMSLAHFADARARWQFDQSVTQLAPRVQALVLRLQLSPAIRIALLAPGSVWNTKRWTPEGYADTARALLQEGWSVLLIGAPDEKALCDEIARHAPGSHGVAGELSLWESCELMTLARLLIANDSGAMHLGAVAGLATVAIFGPTVLAQGYRPWQSRARVVETELACRPCGKHGADRCPIGTHACMTSISARDVLKAAQSFE